MTRSRGFEFFFNDERTVRVRQHFSTSKKDVLAFTVQLEVLLQNRWRAILRFDTAHGFPHIDRLHRNPNKPILKATLSLTPNEALTYAVQDIRERWPVYVERFLRGEYP